MNSRRGFLWALGMGGVSLGLPNVARAFGRRRRHAPVADCECDCAREGTPRMMAQGPGEPEFYSICAIVCPQSLYASMNGVYYYTGQCCNPMGPRNVSSTLFIDCPQSCSNQANCINTAVSIIMSAHGLRSPIRMNCCSRPV